MGHITVFLISLIANIILVFGTLQAWQCALMEGLRVKVKGLLSTVWKVKWDNCALAD